MKKATSYSPEAARVVAIQALAFLTGDEAILKRFLDITGWTPETLASPGSRETLLSAALEYLMSEEDLLLTFAANYGLDPGEVTRASRARQEDAFPGDRFD